MLVGQLEMEQLQLGGEEWGLDGEGWGLGPPWLVWVMGSSGE